ncbi:hypothetical protein [Streptosporangium sp. NPDC051022]|uniref:hypothetical protein n=1 Tax=Streptosporangium sp. NPDC051022 TaxID=3155752 RepID=UPI003436B200
MATKTLFKKAVAFVAATAVAGMISAQPASATASTAYNFPHIFGAQAQVDNNPGNGAPGWIWVNAAGVRAYGYDAAYLDYVLKDGYGFSRLYVGYPAAQAINVPADVYSGQLCVANNAGGSYCGATRYF